MLSENVSSTFRHQRRITKSLWEHFDIRFLWSAIILNTWRHQDWLRDFFNFSIVIERVCPWRAFFKGDSIYLTLHGRLSLEFRGSIMAIVRWKSEWGGIPCIDELSWGLMMHKSGCWGCSYCCCAHFHWIVLSLNKCNVLQLLLFLSERKLHLMLSTIKGWFLVWPSHILNVIV